MSLESNSGTQYYQISCGIPSTTTNLSSNNSTGYYRNSANEYILWGQSTQYQPVASNSGSQYYFLKCGVPSTTTNLSSNNSTGYYYSSAFNCVSFCDAITYYSPYGPEWNGGVPSSSTFDLVYDSYGIVYDLNDLVYA